MPKNKSMSNSDKVEELFQKAMQDVNWTKIQRALEVGKDAHLGVSIFVSDRRESSYLAVQTKVLDEGNDD